MTTSTVIAAALKHLSEELVWDVCADCAAHPADVQAEEAYRAVCDARDALERALHWATLSETNRAPRGAARKPKLGCTPSRS